MLSIATGEHPRWRGGEDGRWLNQVWWCQAVRRVAPPDWSCSNNDQLNLVNCVVTAELESGSKSFLTFKSSLLVSAD